MRKGRERAEATRRFAVPTGIAAPNRGRVENRVGYDRAHVAHAGRRRTRQEHRSRSKVSRRHYPPVDSGQVHGKFPKAPTARRPNASGATRASLISRVKTQWREWQRLNAGVPGEREAWHQIHPALSAWWRVDGADGEIRIYLSMRWELTNQVRQELPGVTDQGSLNRIGKQFGVLHSAPPVSAKLSGGTHHLAVLSDCITEELLSSPDETGDSNGTCSTTANPNTDETCH